MFGFFVLWISNLIASFSKKYNGLIALIFLFILFIIVGYRDFTVGADTKTYYQIYNSIAKGGSDYIEPFYRILNKIVINLGGTYRELLLTVAFITLLFFYLSIKKSSPNILFSIFCLFSLYFLFYAMNIMRQIIAVAIIMYGYTFLNRNQVWKFVFCVLVGSLFHTSAVVSLIALVVKKIRLSDFRIIIFITLSAIIGFLAISTKGIIFSLFLGPYAGYVINGLYIRSSYLAPVFLSFVLSCFFVFIYYTSSILIKQSLWMKLFFISIIINNMFIFMDLGLRLVMFFSTSEIILIPIYIKNNRIKEKCFTIIIISIYLGGVLFTLLSIKSAIVISYSNALFK